MVQWTRACVVAVVLTAASACSGTTDDQAGAGGSTADASQSASSGGTTDGSSSVSTGSGDTSSTTSGGSGKCTAASVNMDDPCEVCVVTSCTAESVACCEQEGCLDIIACAQATGCSGVDCYTPETCQKVIDEAGGVAIAVNFAAPLGECALANCATECGG